MPVVPTTTEPTPYDTGWAWIEETRNLLDGPARPQVNQTAAAIDENATDFKVRRSVNQPTVGSVLSVDLETIYVWDYAENDLTVTVQRGWQESDAEAHPADSIVYVDPRFTTSRIWRALQNECVQLSSEGLFTMETLERGYDSNLTGIDLSSAMLDSGVVAVHVLPAGQDGEWVSLVNDWMVQTDLDTAVYASGRAIFFPRVGPSEGDTVRITYKARLSPLADVNENPVEATGIPYTAADIPPLGAAIRLLAGEPVSRANPTSSPTQRRPGETTTSDIINSGNALRALRATRLSEERARLSGMWPTRRPIRGL